MKQVIIQRVSIVVALAMLMSFIIAGCNNPQSQTTQPSVTTTQSNAVQTPNATTTNPADEWITLRVMNEDRGVGDRANLPIEKKISEISRIKFEYILVPIDNYAEKLKLMLAADDVPDIMMVNGFSKVTQFADQGKFLDFTPYLDKMTNLKAKIASIPGGDRLVNKVGDKIYGIYRFGSKITVPWGFYYRGDLLAKNSLSVPTTTDEFYNVLKKLKEKYPDSMPLGSLSDGLMLSTFYAMYHTGMGTYFNQDEGKYKYGPVEKNFKDAVQAFAKLYQAKLVDPEFTTNSEAAFIEKINNSKVLATISYWGYITDAVATLSKTASDVKFVAGLPLTTESGLKGRIAAVYPVDGGIGIQVSAKTKYVDRIIKFVDWRFSDEAMILANWGIEGTHYTLKNGKPEFTAAVKTVSNPNGTIAPTDIGLDQRSGMWIPWIYEAEAEKFYAPLWKPFADLYVEKSKEICTYASPSLTISQDLKDEYSKVMTPINTYANEMVMKFITGAESMDKWDAYIAKINSMGDYQTTIDKCRNAVMTEQKATPMKP